MTSRCGPHDQPGGLQSSSTQSDPTPSSHEQVSSFLPRVYLLLSEDTS